MTSPKFRVSHVGRYLPKPSQVDRQAGDRFDVSPALPTTLHPSLGAELGSLTFVAEVRGITKRSAGSDFPPIAEPSDAVDPKAVTEIRLGLLPGSGEERFPAVDVVGAAILGAVIAIQNPEVR